MRRLRTWLLGIARRVFLEELRWRRPRVVPGDQAAPAPSPVADLLIAEQVRLLRAALVRVAVERRGVVLLRLDHGLLAALGAMTVRTSQDFLYMDGLYGKWATLVPAASIKPPDAGRLRLALRDVTDKDDQAQVHTKLFLGSLVTAHAFTVDVNTPLDGLGTDDSVLRALGLHASQAAGKGKVNPVGPPPDANVDMDKDGKNESVVEAMSATGKVTTQELHVREQPTTKGKLHPTTLKKGDQVHIMGAVDTWHLVDHAGVRGYSAKQYIEVV